MEIYQQIHRMKKKSSWTIDEILDMPPLDWSIFVNLELQDMQKKNK